MYTGTKFIQWLWHSMQACSLSAHPSSFINCHSRIERVFILHSNRWCTSVASDDLEPSSRAFKVSMPCHIWRTEPCNKILLIPILLKYHFQHIDQLSAFEVHRSWRYARSDKPTDLCLLWPPTDSLCLLTSQMLVWGVAQAYDLHEGYGLFEG